MAKESIKGIPETIKQLRAFGKDIEKLIDAETSDIAEQIESDAKKLAPKNFGKLAQSISSSKVKMSNYKITVNEIYGAYMEFGTGTKVRVPKELSSVAASFKGGGKKGSYKEGLEAIKNWCRAKGIDEKFAYVIFSKILGAGVNPQPFLYPAWVKGRKDYLNNLKKLLKAKKKKI
jgi:HK97 gp10 family phage protein